MEQYKGKFQGGNWGFHILGKRSEQYNKKKL